jgi:glycosyltransferase involved in cell wall biosynthesis
MTIRVLHVITGLHTGGAERMLEKVVTFENRHCTDVVVSLLDVGPVGRRLVERGIQVHALGLSRGGFSPAALWRLVKIFRGFKPGVVQGWMYHGNLAASVAAELSYLRGVKVHWGIRQTLYALDKEKRGTRAVINLLARMSRRPASIHYNSHKSREQHEFIGYESARATIIPNGFDVDVCKREEQEIRAAREQWGIPGDAFVIGMVTRDHPMKDHRTFLEAAARFARVEDNAWFLLAGRGISADNGTLAGAIAELGLESRTRLVGEQADPGTIYRALDVLALTSAWGEAFPNVLGEAMSFGIPCVATDVGDCEDIVGESGIIVPVHDPEAVSRAFFDLQSIGIEGRRQLGTIARARVLQNFSIRDVCQRFNDLHGIQ